MICPGNFPIFRKVPTFVVISFILLLSINAFSYPANTFTYKITGRTTAKASVIIDEITSVFSVVNNFYETAPYTAAFVTCGLKASAADIVAQLRSQSVRLDLDENTKSSKKGTARIGNRVINLEIQRNLAFLIYGSFYQGLAQNYIYNHLFPSWFGEGSDLSVATVKTLFDLLVVCPLLCLPIAYITKAIVNGNDWRKGLKKYVVDVKCNKLLLSFYEIWFPAELIIFGVVPEHLRIPSMAFVSFFWLTVFSAVSCSNGQD